MIDPLGLTVEQRTWSNIHAGFRHQEIWWPPQVTPIVEAHVREDACENCRTVEGHARDCIGLLASTLHELGLEIDMKLIPREEG